MSGQIPLVDYLVLGEQPHLEAYQCATCGACFFDRRNACAACYTTSFERAPIPTVGVLRTFTIVEQSAPGVAVPFIAGIVDCDGISVRTNIINVEPLPELVHTGMKVSLATYSLGTKHGCEVIGFGYEPTELGGEIN